jgi:radical SAM protein with 4Fe4S-binding SPASM domain
VRKKPVQFGKPMTVSIEPTTSCNLRCPECPSGMRSFSRATGDLDIDFFKGIIDQIQRELMYLIFYFQGEPYLNRHFTEMIKYASDKKIYTITSTNGHFLNDDNARKTIESGLDRLIISIDGTTQEVYESYRRGGSLEKALQGAKNINNWKKILKSRRPYLVFQFLVVKPNEHQIEELKILAKQYGVDKVSLKSAQIYDFENGNPLIPDNLGYSRYRKNSDGTYRIKNKLRNSCWKMWHSCVITWDGKVLPCCFDKDAQFILGDLKSHSFDQIWHDQKYHDFRYGILQNRKSNEMCRNCTEGTGVLI